MNLHLLWQNYRYFPYERELARREVHAMMGQRPSEDKAGLVVNAHPGWPSLARRTTYFREVLGDGGQKVIPLQAQLEAVTNGSTIPSNSNLTALPTRARQSTRYSGHGLHEYRGKFNPQVVRAISNILGLKPGDWLFDPFCGSGTALLESLHLEMNAVGIDLNPLAVEITNAKIASMRVPSDQLLEQTAGLKLSLSERIDGLRFDKPFSATQARRVAGNDWQRRLNSPTYLRLWFAESVLAQLASIMQEIERLPSNDVRLIMRVVLSNVARDVSLQDPTDLRIRRRKSSPENEPAIPLFLDSLSRKLSCILKARQLVQGTSGTQVALLGNVLSCRELLQKEHRRVGVRHFDAAITSPPYASALPYIDTQRLSLVLLGLIDARQIRDAERSLIGNREITPGERADLEKALKENKDKLPHECASICQELHDAVDLQTDGFRRQNLPGLLYKYLTEMAGMFRQVRTVLRSGGHYALIVGRNSTLLGGKHFMIDTPRLLSLLAEANGFRLSETMELDAYHRFDVHQANSIKTEMLIILVKP